MSHVGISFKLLGVAAFMKQPVAAFFQILDLTEEQKKKIITWTATDYIVTKQMYCIINANGSVTTQIFNRSALLISFINKSVINLWVEIPIVTSFPIEKRKVWIEQRAQMSQSFVFRCCFSISTLCSFLMMLYFVKCTSPSGSKTPPQHRAAPPPVLHRCDDVLRLISASLLSPIVTMVIMAKHLNQATECVSKN